MVGSARAVSGVVIRLTDERWTHITEEHPELSECRQEVLDTIAAPEAVFSGGFGELLAVRLYEPGKYTVVVQREQVPIDGFVITAFMTQRIRQIESRAKIWPTSTYSS